MNAYVACTCYREGLASDPPIPLSQLMINERGNVELRDDADFQQCRLLDDWVVSACAHPDMQFVEEWISNIAGVAELRSAVADLDKGRYGLVVAIVSRLSGLMDETMSAEDARRVLPELRAMLEDRQAPDQHLHTFRTIAELFEASAMTGNPVVWC